MARIANVCSNLASSTSSFDDDARRHDDGLVVVGKGDVEMEILLVNCGRRSLGSNTIDVKAFAALVQNPTMRSKEDMDFIVVVVRFFPGVPIEMKTVLVYLVKSTSR